jgi:ferritin
MLNEKILKALNRQTNAELASAYLYLAMAAWFDGRNLRGCAGWLKVQAQEELLHAMKLYGYINERGGKVTLAALEAPAAEWSSPQAVFEAVRAHEQKVTRAIGELADLAAAERDHATSGLLQWYVGEQVEEEANAEDLVHKITMVGQSTHGLYLLDKELGGRKAGGD